MKKRLLTMLTLCSCAVLLASCRASADTRTGQADGYGGILRVQVMMEDGAISAVNILEQHETDGIGSRYSAGRDDSHEHMGCGCRDGRNDDEQCSA